MKKIISIFITGLLLVIFSTFTVCEASSYVSYAYDSQKKVQEAPDAARHIATIKLDGNGLNEPSDIFLGSDGYLYISDTGNNRIVVMDKLGNVIKVIKEYTYNGEVRNFNGPSGVFVKDDGTLCVCDTENGCIVFLKDLQAIKLITAPQSELLPEKFSFEPTKLVINEYGQMFIVSRGFNMGILQLADDGSFISAMGAPKVSITPLELLWRKFSTKEQIERSESYVPTEYNNVMLNEDGFLFVTTYAYTPEEYENGTIYPLQCLNAKGDDVLIRNGDPSGDYENIHSASYKGLSKIVDSCSLENGGYAILDQNRGRVFAYNSEGEALYCFGGPGEFVDGFKTPISMVYEDGRYYIVDLAKGTISVFEISDYGKLFHELLKAQKELDYEYEEELWNVINYTNPGQDSVFKGLGNAAYRRQDMKEAMRYYKMANDKESYSKAYTFVRRDFIENNIAWILLVAVATIVVYIVYKKQKKKYIVNANRLIKTLDYSNYVIWHPMEGFWDIKREFKGSLSAAFVLIGLSCGVKFFADTCSGFIFNSHTGKKYNPIIEIGIILLIILVWCICQWCVTSLMDGKGKFVDIFIATAYSLMPYIKLAVIATLMSRVMLQAEAEFYNMLMTIALMAVVYLIVIGVKQTHDYSMLKTLVVILITLIVILLLAFIVMLIIALMQQFIVFIASVYNEISLRI